MPTPPAQNGKFDKMMEEVEKEKIEQENILAELTDENGKETYSTVFWLNDMSCKLQSGRGVRFMLRKAPPGKVSEYVVQIGNFHKTKNQRYSRQGENYKMDLTVQEWKALVDKTPEMIEKFTEAYQHESSRYVFYVLQYCVKSTYYFTDSKRSRRTLIRR